MTQDHLPAVAELLASRHDRQRRTHPLLPAAYATGRGSRALLDDLTSREGALGAVALRDGEVVGFLVGTPRPDRLWGDNVWVECGGHAVLHTDDVRDLWAFCAQRWFDAGLTEHYAVVPADEPALLDAWFRLGFGQQHAQGLLGHPVTVPPPPDVTLRTASEADVPALAELDLELPRHQAASPVFSSGAIPSLDEAADDWAETLGDDRFVTWVAERDGRVVGAAAGCPAELSRMHSGLARPESAGLLSFAAVHPEGRGRGIGTAAASRVIAELFGRGVTCVVTDWRVTNLTSSRAWTRLGFVPTYLRLHRRLGY